MRYIVADLEWNNTYAPKTRGFINEIIEIGAVMLDESFDIISEFSCFIKPQIGKKLRSTVKQLTHITNDDINGGLPVTKALSNFKRWIGSGDNVLLTWGDGDIRVMIDNFRYLNGIGNIPFLSYYADAQKYFQIRQGISKANQIGLSTAAESVGIQAEDYSHHRALDDSKLTAECLRRVLDRRELAKLITPCDDKFYQKLAFKPHAISNINSPLIDKSLLSYTCEDCGCSGRQLSEWKYSNQYFRAVFKCPTCGKKVRVAVRFKKYFDRLETRKTVTVIPDEKPDNVKKDCRAN